MIIPIQVHIINRIRSPRRAATELNGQRIRPPVTIIRKHVAPRLGRERRIIAIRRADIYQLPNAVERVGGATTPVGLAAVDAHLRGVGEVELDTVAEAREILRDVCAAGATALTVVHAESTAGVGFSGKASWMREVG